MPSMASQCLSHSLPGSEISWEGQAARTTDNDAAGQAGQGENIWKCCQSTTWDKSDENCQVEVLPLGGLRGFDCTTHWSKPLLRLCTPSSLQLMPVWLNPTPVPPKDVFTTHLPGVQVLRYQRIPSKSSNPWSAHQCTSDHQCTSRIEWKFVNTVAVTVIRLVNSERTQCTLQFSTVQLLTAPANLGSHTFLDLLRCPADSGTSPRTRHGHSP